MEPPGVNVVIRYLDGRIEKCVGRRTIAVNHRTFQIITRAGGVKGVPLADLKAIFFVKDLAGNPDYDEEREVTEDSPRLGYTVRVRFRDGEELVGKSMNPKFSRNGFYMEPVDRKSNNDRIFVVRENVKSIEVTPG